MSPIDTSTGGVSANGVINWESDKTEGYLHTISNINIVIPILSLTDVTELILNDEN